MSNILSLQHYDVIKTTQLNPLVKRKIKADYKYKGQTEV